MLEQRMNLSITGIRISIVCLLVAILVGQWLWIQNMYQAYQDQWMSGVDQAIERAILREVSSRHEQLGGTVAYRPGSEKRDTARYITKTVHAVDTTFQVTIDRHDPFSENKLYQFMLKDHLPMNVKQLDSLFRLELMLLRFPLTETGIDYIDLKTHEVLQRTHQHAGGTQKWLSTEVIPIDIFEIIGVRAHAKVISVAILERMTFQLILSLLLISFCIFFLFTIIRTIFWREKVEAMRRESIDTMTHEFKRPISSAVAQVALIPYYLEKGRLDKASKYAENTLLELNKLTAYTERIQSISKGADLSLTLNKTSVYLPDFLKRVHKKYANAENGMELEIVYDSTLEYLTADLLHMLNVLDNLIENAIKYSKDNLKIIVDVRDEKDGLLIQVKDNGIGITKTEVNKVFDRYFRSSNGQQRTANGFGLGLTYCKLVVDEHGGSIRVESELGIGTTFSVRLPKD